jgi:hypothetical protein
LRLKAIAPRMVQKTLRELKCTEALKIDSFLTFRNYKEYFL